MVCVWTAGEAGDWAFVGLGGHVGRGNMKGEYCPLLWCSDPGRLAPQVCSVREMAGQACGQGRGRHTPASQHLIITQPEEAL